MYSILELPQILWQSLPICFFPVTGLLNMFFFGGSGDLAEHYTFYPEKEASTMSDTAASAVDTYVLPLLAHI